MEVNLPPGKAKAGKRTQSRRIRPEKEEPEKNGRKALCTKYESRIRKTQKCLKDE